MVRASGQRILILPLKVREKHDHQTFQTQISTSHHSPDSLRKAKLSSVAETELQSEAQIASLTDGDAGMTF